MNKFTISEARNKLCPFSFNAPDGAGVCRGDRCMAWRWEDKEFIERGFYLQQYSKRDRNGTPIMGEFEYRLPIDAQRELDRLLAIGYEEFKQGSDQPRRIYVRKRIEPRTGFCGLAEPRLMEVSQ
jgi:hypothetical protein